MKAIVLKRPLPMLVCTDGCIYDVHMEFEDSTAQWHLAASKFGDGFSALVTEGKPTYEELGKALKTGIPLFAGSRAAAVADELVHHGRAEFVDAA